MPNIIGEEVRPYVSDQINARQILHGSGTDSNPRTNDQLVILNSNTSWVKFASGVKIDDYKIRDLEIDHSNLGLNLAKRNVLFGGISTLNGTTLVQKDGFLDGTYEPSDFGIVPMPGIISAKIQTLTRGSIKKATINFKVYNRRQFKIIDTLYLRLGYTVLLEWGNNFFTPEGTTKDNVLGTLIEDVDGFFSDAYQNNASHRTFLGKISNYREIYKGNYDGVLGKITNFNWSFNEDGSYDIEVSLHSLGDVIESLKVNTPINPEFENFIKTVDPNYDPNNSENSTIIEQNRSKSLLHFNLWLLKWFNRNSDLSQKITMTTEEGESKNLGSRSEDYGEETITKKSYQITLRHSNLGFWSSAVISTAIIDEDEFNEGNAGDLLREYGYDSDYEIEKELIKVAMRENIDGSPRYLDVKVVSDVTITNPITGFSNLDIFKLHTKPDNKYYIRFGALLKFISEKIIPRIDKNNGEKLVDIDYTNATMYTLPNQISLDPRVCVVKNNVTLPNGEGTISYFNELKNFVISPFIFPGNPNPPPTLVNEANPMNIYINFESIINSLDGNQDEKGEIHVYNFISSLCTDINKALGGINNLEPVLNEESNILYIIDSTPLPGKIKPSGNYVLNLYGYDDKESNFIRKVDIKTAITPEYATMVTVGATAGGYTQGVEATAFSKWNKGIIDRFKEKLVSPDEVFDFGIPDPLKNYIDKFLYGKSNQLGYPSKFAYPTDGYEDEFAQDIIDQNLSIVPEFYKYAMSLKTKSTEGVGVSGGTIGFIPFKINLTMDGLSGIKIYNVLHIDSRFLPEVYGKSLDFIVTGIEHTLQKDDWETSLTVTVMPKSVSSSPVSGVLLNPATNNNIPDYEFIYKDQNIIAKVSNFIKNTSNEFKEDVVDFFGTLKKKINEAPKNQNKNKGKGEILKANEKYAAPYGLNITKKEDAEAKPFKDLQEIIKVDLPLIYSGVPIPNNQKTTDRTPVKLSDLTFVKNINTTKSLTQWKDSSGKFHEIQLKNANGKSNKYSVLLNTKMHKDAIASFRTAFSQIVAHYGKEKVYDLGLNCCSGAYYPKNSSGGGISMHCWGIAIDICSAYGPDNSFPKWKKGDNIPQLAKSEYKKFHEIMINNGWYCGFKNKRDLMHFQKIKGPNSLDPAVL
jgi:hypothetical protein